mmetsp:Transcript_50221/g.130734  ORF Transcript_50221/g.130734 Transcript_50221/m.130734 type:complete len:189 (+) Transcript_50221:122-688(+)
MQDDWHGVGGVGSQVVYDLTPIDPDRGFCFGELCVAACEAIDGYRAFMDSLTLFRTILVTRVTADGVRGTREACPYDDGRFADLLERVARELPATVAALRAASRGLAASCAVPPRTGLTPEAVGFHACAPGCPRSQLGDGICQAACNTEACLHDLLDCKCAPMDGTEGGRTWNWRCYIDALNASAAGF